jgi:chromosome segregation ATPase
MHHIAYEASSQDVGPASPKISASNICDAAITALKADDPAIESSTNQHQTQQNMGQHLEQIQNRIVDLLSNHNLGKSLEARISRMSHILSEPRGLPAMHSRVLRAMDKLACSSHQAALSVSSVPAVSPRGSSISTNIQELLEVLSQYEHFCTSHEMASDFAEDEVAALKEHSEALHTKLVAHERSVRIRKQQLSIKVQELKVAQQKQQKEEAEAGRRLSDTREAFKRAKAVMDKAEADASACNQMLSATGHSLAKNMKNQRNLDSGPVVRAAKLLQQKLEKEQVSRAMCIAIV